MLESLWGPNEFQRATRNQRQNFPFNWQANHTFSSKEITSSSQSVQSYISSHLQLLLQIMWCFRWAWTKLNNCGLVFSQECIPKVCMQSVYPCTIFREACMQSLYSYTGFCNACMHTHFFPKCVWKLSYSMFLPAVARGPHFFQRVYAKQLCIHRCILTCFLGESAYPNMLKRPLP